jgi:tRNA pseudouridine38-40 synthase
MALYKIILAYDGTLFCGFQKQGRKRTVQAEFETALAKLGWQGERILAAGRTDRGVHAEGQVICFQFEWPHSTEKLQNALNANLPLDMAVREVSHAPSGFHPRFDASWRRYRYAIFFDPHRHPLREHYAWRLWPPIDTESLNAVAEIFVGKHDFSALGAPTREGGTTVRTIFGASWNSEVDRMMFEVRADAFLYRMVRRMVRLQIEYGRGHLSLERVTEIVEQGSKHSCGIAPPNGLVLVEVNY